MDKVKHISIRLVFIFISFFFIEGGRNFVLADNSIQIFVNSNENSDPEIPHDHFSNNPDGDEKWIKSNSFEFSYSSENLILLPYYLNKGTEDYTELVWQPPKNFV